MKDLPERPDDWPLRIQVPEPPPIWESVRPSLVTCAIFTGLSLFLWVAHLIIPMLPKPDLAVSLIGSLVVSVLVFLVARFG